MSERACFGSEDWKVSIIIFINFLVYTYCLPLNRFVFVPEIFVSVLAQGTSDQFKVLFQGMQLRSDTLNDTIALFGREFTNFENEIANQRLGSHQQSSSAQQQIGSGSDLGAMIQMGMLALNLLPAGMHSSGLMILFFNIFYSHIYFGIFHLSCH